MNEHMCNKNNDLISQLPNEDFIYDLADFFKVFADSTRMKIIFALLDSELCVCDIARIINSTQSGVSHQ